jgi:hypothetical protein
LWELHNSTRDLHRIIRDEIYKIAVGSLHAMDDALTPAQITVLRLIAAGNANKQICRSALNYGRNGEEPGEVHPFQVGSQRSNPRRHDRFEERIIDL